MLLLLCSFFMIRIYLLIQFNVCEKQEKNIIVFRFYYDVYDIIQVPSYLLFSQFYFYRRSFPSSLQLCPHIFAFFFVVVLLESVTYRCDFQISISFMSQKCLNLLPLGFNSVKMYWADGWRILSRVKNIRFSVVSPHWKSLHRTFLISNTFSPLLSHASCNVTEIDVFFQYLEKIFSFQLLLTEFNIPM